MQRARRIAIDGPAGSGKSTVGERLAKRLGYLYIDTGAMYRAVAWLALKEGVDLHDGPALGRLARRAEIVITHPQINDGRQYTVLVRGEDVTWAIRGEEVTRVVSAVSRHPEVRTVMREQQHALAQQGNVVMVGRDIGAVVLPDAELKIYLTASLEERGRRRYAEFARGRPVLPPMAEVLEDIRRRDEADKQNMQPAPDAIIIDTSHLSIPQVLDVICGYLEERA